MPDARDVAAALIEAHRRGDPRAAARLVEYLREPLLRTARHILEDGASAEDVFVESIARLLPRLHAFDHPLAFWTYAHRTARNCAVDMLRRRHVRDSRRALRDTSHIAPRMAPEDPVDRLPSGGPGPEQQILAAEQRRRVRDEVERLREPGRTIVIRFYEGGLSYRQIADELGISETGVKRHLGAARSLLAARMEETGERDGV